MMLVSDRFFFLWFPKDSPTGNSSILDFGNKYFWICSLIAIETATATDLFELKKFIHNKQLTLLPLSLFIFSSKFFVTLSLYIYLYTLFLTICYSPSFLPQTLRYSLTFSLLPQTLCYSLSTFPNSVILFLSIPPNFSLLSQVLNYSLSFSLNSSLHSLCSYTPKCFVSLSFSLLSQILYYSLFTRPNSVTLSLSLSPYFPKVFVNLSLFLSTPPNALLISLSRCWKDNGANLSFFSP